MLRIQLWNLNFYLKDNQKTIINLKVIRKNKRQFYNLWIICFVKPYLIDSKKDNKAMKN